MLRISFSARLGRREELRDVADRLMGVADANGKDEWIFHVVSRWLDSEGPDSSSDYERRCVAKNDVRDVRVSDAHIVFTDDGEGSARGGRHCELGVALALGIPCFLIGPEEHIFHSLCRKVESVDRLITELIALEVSR